MLITFVWLVSHTSIVRHYPFYRLITFPRRLLTPGGEVPMAFVVLTKDAAAQVERDSEATARIKASIMKVKAFQWFVVSLELIFVLPACR